MHYVSAAHPIRETSQAKMHSDKRKGTPQSRGSPSSHSLPFNLQLTDGPVATVVLTASDVLSVVVK